ncbi:MAG TPA: glycine--tRNA ligase [Thermoanaerobaculia bacterium]|nr:glycine--tRNA ligase [Thermoanaerobaculia bacterium]
MSRPTGSELMERIVALAKRRGFVFPASEIYGGVNGFWDYGPLGVQLKNNLRDAWWHDTVLCPPIGPDGHPVDVVGLDSAIIQNPRVWEASGHVAGFSDPMVDCRETKARYRADHLQVLLFDGAGEGEQALLVFVEGEPEPALKRAQKVLRRKVDLDEAQRMPFSSLSADQRERVWAPGASEPGTLTAPREFNLMFRTRIGATSGDDNVAYLRPETAQGIFLNYKNVVDTTRVKIPFGIAQVGKAFRNEVTPRNFIFRSREFEQMEMEWFCEPEEAPRWFEFWVNERLEWWKSVGVSEANLRLRKHEADELAHYAKSGEGTYDVEYRYPFTEPGFGELEGIAHRGCFDLEQHQEWSKTKLEAFDPQTQRRFLPHVIEPASGLTRGVLVLLCEAYDVDPERPSPEIMRFPPRLAPIKAGIFPLVAKAGMPEIAEKLYLDLRARFPAQFDVKQSIGKRYARMDEAGTPYCFTIDGQSVEDQTVTVRDRDTGSQERIALDAVAGFLSERV